MTRATCKSCSREYYYDADKVTPLRDRNYDTVIENSNRVRLFMRKKSSDSNSSRIRYCIEYCSRESCEEPSDISEGESQSGTGSEKDSDSNVSELRRRSYGKPSDRKLRSATSGSDSGVNESSTDDETSTASDSSHDTRRGTKRMRQDAGGFDDDVSDEATAVSDDSDADSDEEDTPTDALALQSFVRKMRRLRLDERVAGIYYAYAGQIIVEKYRYKAFFLMIGNQHGVFYDTEDDVYVRVGNFKTINSDVFTGWLERVIKKLPDKSRLILDASTWQYQEFWPENSRGTNKTIMTRNICARLKYYDWEFIVDADERAAAQKKFHDHFRTLDTTRVTARMMNRELTVDLMHDLIQDMYFDKCISDQICKENGVKLVRQPPHSKNLNFIRHVVMYIQDIVRPQIPHFASTNAITNAIKGHIANIADNLNLLDQLFEDLKWAEDKVFLTNE
ncbi:hypothetical protein HDE_11117 [Halotydeus destructor]|nr:hypothetical protein HDE_11117 [Halotydeus destructor]